LLSFTIIFIFILDNSKENDIIVQQQYKTKHKHMKTILITLITATVAFGNTLPPTPENTLPPTWELVAQDDFEITPHLEA